MTTLKSEHKPIDILEGVEPSTDSTAFHTNHWVSSDKIRFVNGRPRKIGGWASIDFNYSASMSGKCRTIFSVLLSDKVYTLLGTHQKLYSLSGTVLTNITPLNVSTTAIASSLDTHYATLGNDPAATTSGSTTVAITDSEASLFAAGDTYTLSGFSGSQNGIPDTELNADHIVRSVGSGVINIQVTTSATSTGSTGGASVVRTSGLITVNATGHGQANGDRTKIAGAADFGGFTASSEVNIEHIIRNVDTNTFDIMTTGTATSSVSGGGGASTTYQVEIDDGSADESFGQGYGMGKYGVGLYGVSKLSTNSKVYPRIWYCDRYGDVVIGTPGEGTGLYSWDGDSTAAPALVTNAPTAINYAFVSDNIAVTFGSSGVENRIATSDQNALTTWSATSTNQVYVDDIEGAGRLISHANVNGVNLIFTEGQTYIFRYIGLPLVWDIAILDANKGIIGPMARHVVNGVAYWMGDNNFYMWRGGNVEIIPSNSTKMSTILNYVFDNINRSQKSKCFAEYVEKYNELRFHYPSSNSTECDRVACVSLNTFAWWPDTIGRTAAEYPQQLLSYHRMVDSSGVLYYHETTNNNDGSAMTFSLKSPRRYGGKNNAIIVGIIPDSIQTSDLTVTLNTYAYPQSSTARNTDALTVTPTTEIIPLSSTGRYWDWSITGSVVDQNWIMGDWMDEIQQGSNR